MKNLLIACIPLIANLQINSGAEISSGVIREVNNIDFLCHILASLVLQFLFAFTSVSHCYNTMQLQLFSTVHFAYYS